MKRRRLDFSLPRSAFLFHWTPLCLHAAAWLTWKNPFIFAEMTASTALKRWLPSFAGTVGTAECPENQGQACQLFRTCFSRTGSPVRTLNPSQDLRGWLRRSLRPPRTGATAASQPLWLAKFSRKGKRRLFPQAIQEAVWALQHGCGKVPRSHISSCQSMSQQHSGEGREDCSPEDWMPMLGFCFKIITTEMRRQFSQFCIILIIAIIYWLPTMCQALPVVMLCRHAHLSLQKFCVFFFYLHFINEKNETEVPRDKAICQKILLINRFIWLWCLRVLFLGQMVNYYLNKKRPI